MEIMGFEREESPLETIEAQTSRFVPEASAASIFGASFREGQRQGLTESIGRLSVMDDLHNTGELISPDVAKAEYGLSTDRDLSRQEAIHIQDLNMESKDRSDIIQTASDSLWKGTILPFVGNMVGALSDPLDFTIGVATGGIATAVGKKLAAGKLLTFGFNAVENVVANGITEVVNQNATQQELQEYTTEQMFNNVVMGSLAMTSAVHGLKLGIGSISNISKLGSKHVDTTQRMAEIASENGLDVGKTVDMIEAKAAKAMELDEGIVNATHDSMGPKAQEILDSVDNSKDLIRVINEKAIAGEIDVAQVEGFKQAALDNGSSKERLNALTDENADTPFTEADRAEFARAMKSDEFKLGSTPESIEPARIYEEPVQNVELEQQFATVKELNSPTTAKYVQEAELFDTQSRVANDYLACLGWI